MDTAVGLVKAYLELCGYFVLAELPVRERAGGDYRDVTDLDVVAVRFAHTPADTSGLDARPLQLFLGSDPSLGTFEEGLDVLIGEVKEGRARFNPALHRVDTIAFALRRVGCCPADRVEVEAGKIARTGSQEMLLPGGSRCRVRLVAFGSHGTARELGTRTISLSRCADYITERLRWSSDIMKGTQFKDPILGLFALQQKLDD